MDLDFDLDLDFGLRIPFCCVVCHVCFCYCRLWGSMYWLSFLGKSRRLSSVVGVMSQVKVIDFRLTRFKLVITLAHVSQMGRRDLYIYGKGLRVRNVVHVPVTTAIDCAVAQLALRIHLSTMPIVVIEC